MSQLLKKYMTRQEKYNPKLRVNKSDREKANSKGISLLVAKFENIFTNPDSEYIKQEDPPEIDNVRLANLEEGDVKETAEPYMYFIRNGRYTVHVKDNFVTKTTITSEDESKLDRDQFMVRELYDGDHFGEIGVIFNTKRTATVRSENYGTLARLTKSSYLEMLKTFDSMSTLFK
jgi:CRP-like cAMP-binding protein